MLPDDDAHDSASLSGLLREWPAPSVPAALDQRVLKSCSHHQPWWRFLFTGYIRVPVYVLYVLAVLLTAAGWRFAARGPSAPCSTQAQIATASRVSLKVSASPLSTRCNHPTAAGYC